MHGAGYVNCMGRYCWVAAKEHGLFGVVVTEQEEPQTVRMTPRCHEDIGAGLAPAQHAADVVAVAELADGVVDAVSGVHDAMGAQAQRRDPAEATSGEPRRV
jgi:hypothetical protein